MARPHRLALRTSPRFDEPTRRPCFEVAHDLARVCSRRDYDVYVVRAHVPGMETPRAEATNLLDRLKDDGARRLAETHRWGLK
jgi:hypothetical protein